MERKTQKFRALACIAIVITHLFCAEFDGLIFRFPLLYPIYHYSRYALDIVIFECIFEVLILIFANPITIPG